MYMLMQILQEQSGEKVNTGGFCGISEHRIEPRASAYAWEKKKKVLHTVCGYRLVYFGDCLVL